MLCVVGCGSGGAPPPKMYPVTGTLKVKGKALENVTVQLIPADQLAKDSKPAVGTTDAEGKFTMRTNGDKGVIAGKYKVVLITTNSPGSGPVSLEEATKMSGQYAATQGPPKIEQPFPQEWGSATTTPKVHEVVDKPTEINIDI